MGPPFMYLLVLLLSVCGHALDQLLTEAEALTRLKASLLHHNGNGNDKDNRVFLPDWNPSGEPPPCSVHNNNNNRRINKSNWAGVICAGGRVWGLRLENMGLTGPLDLDAFLQLRHLRTLSVKNNRFEGPFPSNLTRSLPKLRSLYLSHNRFEGEIPDDAFKGTHALRRLFLSGNGFSGRIPNSVMGLQRLVELRLEGNRFEGKIPELRLRQLSKFNVADNQLEGPIPETLRNVSASSFAGNKALCGPPLENQPCPPIVLPPNQNLNSNRSNSAKPNSSSELSIAFVLSLLLLLVLLLLLAIFVLLCRRRARQAQRAAAVHPHEKHLHNAPAAAATLLDGISDLQSSPAYIYQIKTYEDAGLQKLVFVCHDFIEPFDLAELLKASAEVLPGTSTFGSSYKATISNGRAPAVAVKRFKQLNNNNNNTTTMGRQQFHEHLSRMGRLNHPNVLPVMAYYYMKEEKLLVSEFVENGSLATHLYGNKDHEGCIIDDDNEEEEYSLAARRRGLDWPTRLKIIKGVARGLAYLDSQLQGLVAHGHLKSSNVLLTQHFDPLLSDYGLVPLMDYDDSAQRLLVSHNSPDFCTKGRLVRKTDVWNLGILILETLVASNCPTSTINVKGLAAWVNEKASLVVSQQHDHIHIFDMRMGGTKGAQGEMRKLLDIGLTCCRIDADQRWTIQEAVDKIEGVRERDHLTTFSSIPRRRQHFDELMELASV